MGKMEPIHGDTLDRWPMCNLEKPEGLNSENTFAECYADHFWKPFFMLSLALVSVIVLLSAVKLCGRSGLS